ncbi:MAG: sigma-54 dependent transcriptional regulator [Porticoccus sp.]|nr:sigma-54 dependent transcriptional regulator [Porticoccus sp.]
MSDQIKQVVVVDSDIDSANSTASLIKFLEYNTHVAMDATDFSKLCASEDNIVAVFIRDTPELKLLKSIIAAVHDTHKDCPCYLLQHDGDYRPLSSMPFKRSVAGTLSFPLSYKDMLGALHESDLLSNSRRNSKGEQSVRLFRGLVGTSRSVLYIRELIKQVAGTEASVLILGESGTGKEVVARNIHDFSNRREQPFVPVNCGAIPAELLESELFGNEKGAFTGAISARQGRFEIADGGTLFLDEIGDMPMNMQVKLLRVLQEKTFERVGSNKTISSDVRIIAATHQNLEQLVTEGKFRMDLFYRLNVFPIELPPLRDRVEDIPLLIKEFVHRMERNKQGSVKLDDCAMASLSKYYWPGNVRELSNLIERLAILFPQQLVKWADLPDKFRPNQDWIAEQLEDSQEQNHQAGISPSEMVILPQGGIDLKNHLADIECSLMTQALGEVDWVVARAAKLLNLQRTTLVEKMRKFEISRPDDMTEF